MKLTDKTTKRGKMKYASEWEIRAQAEVALAETLVSQGHSEYEAEEIAFDYVNRSSISALYDRLSPEEAVRFDERMERLLDGEPV